MLRFSDHALRVQFDDLLLKSAISNSMSIENLAAVSHRRSLSGASLIEIGGFSSDDQIRR